MGTYILLVFYAQNYIVFNIQSDEVILCYIVYDNHKLFEKLQF